MELLLQNTNTEMHPRAEVKICEDSNRHLCQIYAEDKQINNNY